MNKPLEPHAPAFNPHNPYKVDGHNDRHAGLTNRQAIAKDILVALCVQVDINYPKDMKTRAAFAIAQADAFIDTFNATPYVDPEGNQ